MTQEQQATATTVKPNAPGHTPGPWRPVRFRVLAGEREVADTSEITSDRNSGTPEEGIANACLISAAPELLAALKELYDAATNLSERELDHIAARNRARLVIRAAEGREGV